MLTPDMIEAESITPALVYRQILNLTLLVKGAFPAEVSVFSATLQAGLTEEQANPTERTQALKAVLTQLNSLPAEVVESQGNVNDPAFFTTPQNWKSLAIDVLNIFEITSIIGTTQSWALVQRTVDNLLLSDNIQLGLDSSKTGRRY